MGGSGFTMWTFLLPRRSISACCACKHCQGPTRDATCPGSPAELCTRFCSCRVQTGNRLPLREGACCSISGMLCAGYLQPA